MVLPPAMGENRPKADSYPENVVTARAADSFAKAVKLYDKGMYSKARTLFDGIYERTGSTEARGYAILCSAALETYGYVHDIECFCSEYPYSEMIPRLKFAHAANLFEMGKYAECEELYSRMDPQLLRKSTLTEYTFKYAFCAQENGHFDTAYKLFSEVVSKPKSDYTAPSQYSLGYICYKRNGFSEAIDWFAKARKDGRFAEMSDYYTLECRFMLKEYEYVLKNGPKMLDGVPSDRRPRLSRMIAESALVMGDAATAKKYYDLNASGKGEMNRSDRFFAGSVLYAVGDYRGAIENFSKMENRSDSLGQIANYHLAYSYIKTKNKVAAMEAFRDASQQKWDADIEKDALFNYAKLAFDLNTDVSVFKEYLRRYPDRSSQDIYGYIALTALYSHDYQGAIDAYDNIDELTPEMKRNYMKANYLRARQLLSAGSLRSAVPCLKTVTFYSDSNDPFNQLAKYWLSETYYKNGNYADAANVSKSLYNISALGGTQEGSLIPYNIGYAYFNLGDYDQAVKWFGEYARQQEGTYTRSSTDYRKDALTRIADCSFIKGNYAEAAEAYGTVADSYRNPDDVYPYWQSAVAYGLNGKLKKKIERLSEVKEASPEAGHFADAMLDLGRSYVEAKDPKAATICFDRVVSDVKDSSYVAQALLEKAMIARNSKKKDEALEYYKRVAENMSGTEYADNALLAIESIYRSEGRAKEYLAYIENIGKGASKTDAEKDDIYFASAEQLFLDRQYDKARAVLADYMKEYPSGRSFDKAEYYTAECWRLSGDYERARDAYEALIDKGEGQFVETSMLRYADLSYTLEHWQEAYLAYTSLHGKVPAGETGKAALVGRMRSAYRAKLYPEAENCAAAVVVSESSSAALLREAEYVRAKSLLSLSRRDEAFELFRKLSSDKSDAYGAEAEYLLIQDRFDRADYKGVEDLVYSFSESGTTQNYYLAKAFLVLGDAFAEQGDLRQAKATFESVRDGYTPQGETDDIADNVKLRLERLSQISVK